MDYKLLNRSIRVNIPRNVYANFMPKDLLGSSVFFTYPPSTMFYESPGGGRSLPCRFLSVPKAGGSSAFSRS